MKPQIPKDPTPEWAIECMQVVSEFGDPDLLDAVMSLVCGVAPSQKQDKFKHAAAWAAIDYGFARSPELRKAAERYLGVA